MRMETRFLALLVALAACGGSSRKQPSGPVDVAGLVTFQFNGGPVSGAKVRVGGKSVVTTGADGRFSVPGVTSPYDVTVVSGDGAAATAYVGLTRSNPTVALWLTGPGVATVTHSATITGQLSGGAGFPQPAGHQVQVLLTAPATAGAAIVSGTLNPNGSYTLTLDWKGDATLTSTLQAVQWLADVSFNPISFDGAGSVPVTISDNQTLTNQNITLVPVANGRIAGTVSMAAGYTLSTRSLRAFFPPSDSLLIAYDSGGTIAGSFDYPGFSTPGVVFKLTAVGQDASTAFVQAWRAGFAVGSPMTLNVPAAPILQAPTPSATAVTSGSTLSWTALTGAVYEVVVSSSTIGAGPLLEIVTGASSFHLPDLSAMGFAWPKSTTYRTDLLAFGPRTPDDVAGGNEQPPEDQDGVYARAAPGGFTTAP